MARKISPTAKPKHVPKQPADDGKRSRLYLLLLLLGGALAVLFHKGFEPYQVHFALDEPLGFLAASSSSAPGVCAGHWCDFSWLGGENPATSPCPSILLQSILPAHIFLKLYAPLTLLLVGFSAWVMFRELGFGRQVCVLGGIAAGLNMLFLSVACWGLGRWVIAFSMIFLAIAALATKSIRQSWAKAMLAGFAVGLNVVEGFDVGVILSPFVALFAVFVVFQEERSLVSKLCKSVWMAAVVAVCAGAVALHSIVNMVGTQIEGIAGTAQDAQTRQQRWGFNTMWSIPKLETLRVFIPGVFGYRLIDNITSEDRSSAYWGSIGEETKLQDMISDDPQVRTNAARLLGATPNVINVLAGSDTRARAAIVDSFKPKVMRRHTYCGEYAGVFVAVLAFLAISSSVRKSESPWLAPERRAIWFWSAIALFSLLAAWGRHGFVYRWLYELPYASTIRNPMKFMHPFHIAWIIIAGYGLEFLRRRYLRHGAVAKVGSFWSRLTQFEKNWAIAFGLTIAVSLVAVGMLISRKEQLVGFIHDQGFNATLAEQMAVFCWHEVAWFTVFLAASAVLLISIFKGTWLNDKSRWAWIFIGALLIVDLGKADAPWIYYYNWKEKYSPNPVVDVLSQRPFEHRVASRLTPLGDSTLPGERNFYTMCTWWTQNDFPFRDIQTLDIAQASRLPTFDRDYMTTFLPRGNDWSRPARMWTLTNTRFVLGSMEALKQLQARTGADGPAFRLHTRLDMGLKPQAGRFQDFGDLTVAKNANGEWALIEFTNALPRVKLYSHWEIPADDHAALSTLASAQFSPSQTVLVAKETPVAPSSVSTVDPGTVTFADYSPKRIRLHAAAKTAAVLLLNDKFTPNWKVLVDGSPASMLRCNYTMRGVYLSPGEHDVEFSYQPPIVTLYVSVAACLALIGVAVFARIKRSE